MKRIIRKTKKLVRGASTGVLVSLALHGLLLFFAAGFVIFKMTVKQKTEFVAKPVERPKMDLKKPQVKVKKTAKPRVTSRIASKAIASVPNLQLPAVSGMGGSDLGGGIGGFDLVPDLSDMSIFGSTESVNPGNELVGTFYSLNYDRLGKDIEDPGEQGYQTILRRFVESGWNPITLAPYYREPRKLYATSICVPVTWSRLGPSSFGISPYSDRNFKPYRWFVHYKGRIAQKDGGRFRFCGEADDMLIVRLNNKVVFDYQWGGTSDKITGWKKSGDPNDGRWPMGNSSMRIGDWFDLKPGEPVDMEVLLGENPGGHFSAMLGVQKYGEVYDKNQDGMPILPAFKTAEMPPSVKNKILYDLIPDELDLDSDLMFNVY